MQTVHGARLEDESIQLRAGVCAPVPVGCRVCVACLRVPCGATRITGCRIADARAGR